MAVQGAKGETRGKMLKLVKGRKSGYSVREIADKMGLTVATVRFHVRTLVECGDIVASNSLDKTRLDKQGGARYVA